jgi:hypothetical protein
MKVADGALSREPKALCAAAECRIGVKEGGCLAMCRTILSLMLLVTVAPMVKAIETHETVGRGQGVILPRPESDPCPPSTLLKNYDSTVEDACGWQYGGIMPPYYGAFAECYDTGDEAGVVCGVEILLTGVGYPCIPCNLYVWGDDGGIPGVVLSVTVGADPCPVATWPNASTHDFAVDPVQIQGAFWTGWWADFSHQVCGYFTTNDTNGFGGCPYTNIAPGIGYPTGWHNVSIVWGPIQAIGIGAWVQEEPVPARESSWGRVKGIYR